MPDILCLVAQLLLTVRVSTYNIIHRYHYPMKQNSPALTVLVLISVLACSILSFASRVIVNDEFIDDRPNLATCCFFISYPSVRALSYVHIFLSELPIIAYALKLARNITAYYRFLFEAKYLVKLMSSQLLLIVVCLAYCFVILILELISRSNCQWNDGFYNCPQIY